MNILSVANSINSELSQIHAHNDQILDEEERANIFNSIVTLLIEELADSITLSIRERNKNHEFASWSYSFQVKNNIKRIGPNIKKLVSLTNETPEDTYIDCQPKWSSRFKSMTMQRKAKILKDTIWTKEAEIPEQRIELFQDTHGMQSDLDIDLRDLEVDLRRLEAGTKKLIDERMIRAILESTKDMLSKQYIVGIEIALTQHDRDLLMWKFILQSSNSFVKEGQSVEQVLNLVKSLKRSPKLATRPIISPQFNKMSLKDQELALQNTVWGSKSPKPKRKLLPW